MTRRAWMAIGLFFVVSIGVGVGIGYLISDDGGGGKTDALDRKALVLVPLTSRGPSPFMPSVAALQSVGERLGTSATATSPPASRLSPEAIRRVRLPGDQVGLYGGTRNRATCNAAKLVRFLDDNPDKAEAWASVLDISPANIRGYVQGLTPVLLQRDTQVTNHGFSRGQAFSFQAIIQAGAAVFVDQQGVPRVLCACGNPLAPPTPLPSQAPVEGAVWPHFSPDHVASVAPADRPQPRFTLTDPGDGTRFTRPAGSAGAKDGPDPALSKTCHNQEYGYTVHYPKDWYEASKDSPDWTRRPEGVPEGLACDWFGPTVEGLTWPEADLPRGVRIQVFGRSENEDGPPDPPASADRFRLAGFPAAMWEDPDSSGYGLPSVVISVQVDGGGSAGGLTLWSSVTKVGSADTVKHNIEVAKAMLASLEVDEKPSTSGPTTTTTTTTTAAPPATGPTNSGSANLAAFCRVYRENDAKEPSSPEDIVDMWERLLAVSPPDIRPQVAAVADGAKQFFGSGGGDPQAYEASGRQVQAYGEAHC